jgi:beta-glucanase (GH16 family)
MSVKLMRVLVCLLLFSAAASAQLSSAWGVLSRAGDYSNTEEQCYEPANVGVANSLVTLTFKSQSFTCGDTDHSPTGFSYTSGNIYWKTFNFEYGTVEFSGTLTANHSVWDAIWMMGSNCQPIWPNTADNSGSCNWPTSGSQEVDILELRPDQAYEGENIFTSSDSFACAGPTADGNSHVWDFVWTATSSTWKRDGTTYCSTTASGDYMNSAMWLIIQIATRSGDSPASLPLTMSLDYVKVTNSSSVVIFYDDFTTFTPKAQGGVTIRSAASQ